MITIYRGLQQVTLLKDGKYFLGENFSFDTLFQSNSPLDLLNDYLTDCEPCDAIDSESTALLPPLGNQEIWAAGVTYFRSREARMEEAQSSGGDVFYDKVYAAERPELFFKATAQRARGHLDQVCIRKDSTWDVPEPELTLAINCQGKVFGYTIGNDMSSRSIEGENPLYLPQAKVYRGSCALGPALCVGELPPLNETRIQIQISRNSKTHFDAQTDLSQLKRGFDELAEFLYRDNEFPDGALLMTGTALVPNSDFTLQSGDRIRIQIDTLGCLENVVE
ncbi:MAG: fumarylacetoacetate hydrolase family protein [Verrucomicrobiota bacterium]